MKQLNIGCGTKKLVGWINIDKNPMHKPDLLRDIEKGLPFDDNSIDTILCEQTLEHIHDLVFVMNEFHRVLKPNKKLLISVPLITGKWAWIDPTHVNYFNDSSFDFFMARDYNSEGAGVTGWFKGTHKDIKNDNMTLTLVKYKK